jgi:integrase
MPAKARAQVRRLPSGRWQLRYLDRGLGAFGSRSEALDHFEETVRPQLEGRPAARHDVTLAELAGVFLDRHGKVVTDRTVQTLRERLVRPLDRFGEISLAELEGMVDEIAGFAAELPDRYRYSVMSALRQTLEAGVRYGHMTRNPAKLTGKNPQPEPRSIRVFTPAEVQRITAELDARGACAIRFATATGLRPAEWARLEHRDLDRTRRVVTVRGTKTARSRREVPLTSSALAALDDLPSIRRLSPFLFAGPQGGPFDVHNFRRRDWAPAIETAGIIKPARIYDLRSTFASNALARGITVYELARIMGTSVQMIEAHYGALLDTARASLLERLEASHG